MSRLKQDAPGFAQRLLQTASIVTAVWVCPANANDSWVDTATHAFPLQQSDVVRSPSDNELINVVVVLRTRNSKELTRLVEQDTELGGREYETSRSLSGFLPTGGQAKVVSDYLIQSGFKDVKIADDRLLVSATGTSSTVQHAFKTAIVDVNRNGLVGIANVSDVQLPAEVAPLVLSVLGLQTLVRSHATPIPLLTPQRP